MASLRWLLCSMSCALVAAAAACGGDDDPPGTLFELDGELAGDTFFDFPFPSDLRVDADGTAAYAGFPNKGNNRIVTQLTALADARRGFPVMASAYFRFVEALPARTTSELVAADASAPILYIDVDPDSPERGSLVPLVAQTLQPDDTAAAFLLGVGPRPGWVLAPSTTYAVVVRRAVAPGVSPARAISVLAAGRTPSGARGAEMAAVYEPLWPVLDDLGVARDDVLTATVFTTGDEVAVLHERSEAIRVAHDAVISNIRLDPTDGGAHTGYCELLADVTYPQFQKGVAPYSSEGQFVLDGDGVPIKQGELTAPLAITIPSREMPPAGWPLYQFFHGSGGLSSGLVDLGKTLTVGGEPVVGEGPGYVVARHGIAAAASALPLNPERYANASDYEYLNLLNLGAFPFTFQQGVIEQRLLLDALLELRIAPSALGSCSGPTLPATATAHAFNPAKLTAGGQSMGGMYTNMVGAVEPRLGALVPTGAGGYWGKMILDTDLIAGARGFVGGVFATDETQLTFLHPGLSLMTVGWEIAEPMASMARLARRPLPGFPARHVYEPVGLDDVYFPTEIFDAAALAYGNRQAGTELWPQLQDALTLDGLGGIASYPVTANVDGKTRVVVQFASDGIANSHYIYRQLDEVKHQYGCFLDSYVRTETPVVPAPAALTAPCD
ncbi:MAG TPA: hypothetical protein VM261_29355 [Kofleriaceae bacterium]|nr:hypothetical protein [Kofleriaceae bacterium]